VKRGSDIIRSEKGKWNKVESKQKQNWKKGKPPPAK
jgi:hypothetical protein